LHWDCAQINQLLFLQNEANSRPAAWSEVTYCREAVDAASGADALVLLTKWNDFRAPS
jgi:hypothetical protein